MNMDDMILPFINGLTNIMNDIVDEYGQLSDCIVSIMDEIIPLAPISNVMAEVIASILDAYELDKSIKVIIGALHVNYQHSITSITVNDIREIGIKIG